MGIRVILSLSFVFIVFGAQAKEVQWLNNMVAEQEKFSVQKTVSSNKNKTPGFFNTHGFVLFYGSQCPHCKQFAPILKHWATLNQVEVLPLSLDNQPLLEFPKFLPATTEWINAAFGGNAINYPALFLVNPKTNALYPVGFGSMTEAELAHRMEVLIPKIKAYENNESE